MSYKQLTKADSPLDEVRAVGADFYRRPYVRWFLWTQKGSFLSPTADCFGSSGWGAATGAGSGDGSGEILAYSHVGRRRLGSIARAKTCLSRSGSGARQSARACLKLLFATSVFPWRLAVFTIPSLSSRMPCMSTGAGSGPAP